MVSTSPAQNAQPLTALAPGQNARILGFDHPFLSSKFLAMGILPGSAIRLVRKAPLAGALYVQVEDSFYALRTEEAASILVGK